MLGLADQERIHTQVIAWLLTPAYSPLENSERATLIFKLFGVYTSPKEADDIRVVTELKRLDMVVLHPKVFIAVENKLKSHQGTGQLPAYSIEIDALKKTLDFVGQVEDVKVFLTFSGEVSNEKDWTSIDYQHVLNALVSLQLPPGYAADYVSLLSTLLKCRDGFLKDHVSHPEIFSRSGLDTLARLTPLQQKANSVEHFVCSNRLERIFIERLYREAINTAGFHGAIVTESRGKALIQLNLFEFKFTEGKHVFNAGFQLQGDTIKLNIGAEEYAKSKCDWLPDDAIDHLDKHLSNEETRTNKARSRAYRSWSKQIETPPKGMTLQGFSCLLKEEIDSAICTWRTVLDECSKSQIVADIKKLS